MYPSPIANITNGAPSHGVNATEGLLSWIPFIEMNEVIPIDRLNQLPITESDDALRDMLIAINIVDSHVLESIIAYRSARQEGDFSALAGQVRTLVSNSASPFCVTRRDKGLPPPTASVIEAPRSVSPGEAASTLSHSTLIRSAHLSKQYQLKTFDPATDAHTYLEWRFDVKSVCDTETSAAIQVEVLLSALTGPLRLECLESTKDSCSFETVLAYLDKTYMNFRSIRHIEKAYLSCKIGSNESLSNFYARFRRHAKIYESAKNTTLSDDDLIVAFGNGLDENKYGFISSFIETSSDTKSFAEYVQRLIYMTARLPTADMNGINTDNRKRSRPEDGRPQSHRQMKGLGCYRCCEGNHTALTCRNPVKDYEKRCSKCGSRKHKLSDCSVKLLSKCRRCNGQHYESICPTDLPPVAGNKAIDAFDTLQNMLADFSAVDCSFVSSEPFEPTVDCPSALLSFIECDAECNATTTNLIDDSAPTLSIKFTKKTLEGLMDTGAAANFISTDNIIDLVKNGSVSKSDVVRLSPAVKVRFGNGTVFTSDMALKTTITTGNNQNFESSFIICPELNPGLIAGRPLLRSIGFLPPKGEPVALNHVDCGAINVRPAWIETVPTDEDKLRIRVRFPLLENAHTEPIREPQRAYNKITEGIILARLRCMENEGSVVECKLEDLAAVVPVVLVDKKPGTLRKFPDEEVNQRYRITLDLRGYNRLQLHIAGNQPILIPKTLATVESEGKVRGGVDQFQRSSYEILRRIPTDKFHRFSKIDIADAYSSIQLAPPLQNVGTEVYDPVSGKYVYFRCQSLSQGWKYSPVFFRMVANYLTQECRAVIDRDIHIDFFQDDILLTASIASEEKLRIATDIVIAILEKHSLKIRRHKIITASESIIFCGYYLKNGRCQPCPSRRPLTEELSVKLWNDFRRYYPDEREQITHWTRSFAGMMQYLYGFLSPSALEQLRSLYRFDPSNTSFEEYETAFKTLVGYVASGLPLLCLGSIPENSLVCSVIICDANQLSWASIVLKMVSCTSDSHDESPELNDLRTAIASELGIDCHGTHLLPVRICGNRFNGNACKQSSTYRERVAILETISECHCLLEGPVVVISDNRNCILEWHDIDSLTGSLIRKWSCYCETVSAVIWMCRTSYPSLADFLARAIASDLPETQMLSVEANEREGTETETSLKDDIRAAYANDRTYLNNISMSVIYKALKLRRQESSNTTVMDEEIERSMKLFEIGEDDLLWCKINQKFRLYIPEGYSGNLPFGDKSIRIGLLLQAHNPGGIHVGINRTAYGCRDIWWPGISKDLQLLVKGCWTCVQERTRYVKRHHDLSFAVTTAHANRPFASWFIDHTGPFELPQGTFYLFVAVCGFSRFCIAEVVESVDAISTATVLFELFCRLGIPSWIHSDKGSAFTSAVDSELCKLLKVDHRFSPTGHPQSNGVCERTIGTLKKMISLSSRSASSLRSAVSLAVYLQNCLPYSGLQTDLTPYEIVFGFKGRSISDIFFNPVQCTQGFSGEIQYVLRQAYSFYRDSEFAEKSALLISNPDINFKPGDVVVVVKPGSGIRKTSTSGPYILLSLIGSRIWRAFRMDSSSSATVFEYPVDWLKHYKPIPELAGTIFSPPTANPGNATTMTKNDLFLAKTSPTAVGLFQVISVDRNEERIFSAVWRPNRLLEFFKTEETCYVAFATVIFTKIKLSARTIPDCVNQVAAQFFKGGL